MPVTIRTAEMKYKNAQGNYVGINGVADRAINERLAEIDAAGAATIANVNQAISDAQFAVSGITAQRDTMIASIASVAGQGTDTTLTQSGVAADAKAAGESVEALKSAINPLYGEYEPEIVANSYWPVAGASAGIPTAYTGWSRTTRIPCIEGELLKISATVKSVYNLFFTSDQDGAMLSAFTTAIGENDIRVPIGAHYVGLSNTTAGINATTITKIVNATDIKKTETDANDALQLSDVNAKTIKELEVFTRFSSSSQVYTAESLTYASLNTSARTNYESAEKVLSITVSAVSGYRHNINYYKESTSDGTSENGWQSSETTFTRPDDTYKHWYVRFNKADGTNLTDADLLSILNNVTITINYQTIDVPIQTVYVSTTGNDSNNGTSNAPFATLQKAVDSGALIIKAEAGNYAGFSVQNRETQLTIMLASMPSYSTSVPDVPKIKITTEITDGYGIYVSNCSEVKLSDIWVDGVAADCMLLQDIGNIEVTRCYVSNNSANNSMGFRIISANGVFRDCKAWNIVKDGYNIHRYGNTQFINCVAHDCGDDGISHHDGCTGLISGGEYYRCYKGGISSPYGGAKIDIENVYIHDCTQYGIYSMSSSEMLKSSGRISNCVIKNNGTFDIIATYTDLIGWNNIYDTKSVGTQATFTEY